MADSTWETIWQTIKGKIDQFPDQREQGLCQNNTDLLGCQEKDKLVHSQNPWKIVWKEILPCAVYKPYQITAW